MSWVTIIWAMIASACLTLAAVNLLVWCRQRTAWANLLFSSTAVAAAAMAFCELCMLRAQTPAQFGLALRWLHVAALVIIVSLIGFVRFHLRAGRPWLAWATCVLRVFALLLNFSTGQNLNYREITGLRHIPFLGEPIAVAVGVSNPWMLVGQLSLLLFVVFVADATLSVWRRGDRRHALVTGGSIVFFVLTASLQSVLVLWQIVQWPYAPSICFLGIVAAMAYEMSREALRAAQLSADLRESEERLSLAAEAAGFGVWMWSTARNQIWGSERWLGLFGFAPDTAVTFEAVLQRIHPDDRERVERAVRRALADGGEYVGEYRLVLPDHTQRWVAARGRVYPDAQGKPVRMMGATTDITDRKQAELELAQQRSEVAHLSRVTTLGEISGSLAHELNQPLGAILANTEAAQLHLQSQPLNLDEVRAILADIRLDDLRASEIIHGIRAFLRRRELTKEPLEVAGLMEEAVRLIGADAAARKTSLRLEIPPGLPQVLGDRVQLQQVALNLLVNGLDAMSTCPEAERRITIRATCLDPHTVEIAISDRGVGIPPADVGRVFDPFHTTKPGGLGLGLAICRSIVEAHGSSISVQNNPDRGATARFALPACAEGPSP